MIYHQGRRKAAVLAEGAFGEEMGKTAHDLVIFNGGLLWDLVGVIDSRHSGMDAGEVLGIGRRGIPIISSIDEAIRLGAEALLIGAAPVGGRLPDAWRKFIIDAIKGGLDIYSGLHQFLSDDTYLAELASRHGVKLVDVRKPDKSYFRVWDGSVLMLKDMIRVLIAGTDCEAGKNIATYTIYQELSKAKNNACMVGTGQTMLMLGARGLVLDAVPSDFVAGALEKVLIELYDEGCRAAVIEGQAAITHEAYGHVSLGILRGASPTHIVIAHDPTRVYRASFHHGAKPLVVPPPEHELLYLKALNPYQNAKLAGITLNTSKMSIQEAQKTINHYKRVLQIPAVDPLRNGVNDIIKEILGDKESSN